MYISAFSREELSNMTRKEALDKLGVYDTKGTLVQPPKCKKCGSYTLLVELNGEYLQCPDCGAIAPMHKFEDTFFKKGLANG